MRNGLIILWMLLCSITSSSAQVSVGVNLPGVSFGFNQPVYPAFVPVPGYPVYYAPQVNSNYFFYDGMYWVYQRDNWYMSSWYNGPWDLVSPDEVPLFILRVPVRYYRQPPAYFSGWSSDAAPQWGEHWARHGISVDTGGTAGIAPPRPRRPRSLHTSGNIRVIDIRVWNSSRRCKARTIATSRATPWCSNTIRRSQRRARPRLRRESR